MLFTLFAGISSSIHHDDAPFFREMARGMREVFERSECKTIHPIVSGALWEAGVPPDEQKDIPTLAQAIYSRISSRHGDKFSLTIKEQDKPFTLQEILSGCLSRNYCVQLSSKTHKLHGVEMTPFDNYLHDLFHVMAVKHTVHPSLFLRPLHDLHFIYSQKMFADLEKNLKNENEALYRKCIVAGFLTHHETFAFNNPPLSLQENVLDSIKDKDWDEVLQLGVQHGYKKEYAPSIFVKKTDGSLLSSVEVLQQLDLPLDEHTALVTEQAIVLDLNTKKEKIILSVEYQLLDAKDTYWRLKYCGMHEGLITLNEIISAKDHKDQTDWLKEVNAREMKMFQEGMEYMKKTYGSKDHPLAIAFETEKKALLQNLAGPAEVLGFDDGLFE